MEIISALVKNAIHCYFKSSMYQEDNIWYRSQLPASNSLISFWINVYNTLLREVPERVYKFNKSIKFLIMTREPVARVQSWYTQYVIIESAKGKATSTLEDIVYKNALSLPIRRSCYSKSLVKVVTCIPTRAVSYNRWWYIHKGSLLRAT